MRTRLADGAHLPRRPVLKPALVTGRCRRRQVSGAAELGGGAEHVAQGGVHLQVLQPPQQLLERRVLKCLDVLGVRTAHHHEGLHVLQLSHAASQQLRLLLTPSQASLQVSLLLRVQREGLPPLRGVDVVPHAAHVLLQFIPPHLQSHQGVLLVGKCLLQVAMKRLSIEQQLPVPSGAHPAIVEGHCIAIKPRLPGCLLTGDKVHWRWQRRRRRLSPSFRRARTYPLSWRRGGRRPSLVWSDLGLRALRASFHQIRRGCSSVGSRRPQSGHQLAIAPRTTLVAPRGGLRGGPGPGGIV
mmetsp:Transcript_2272/g.6778  ORF Transcript_2272/g.6778 Transcript_2272/m.6778 type:complete len:298 (+) Transcript_2272:5722-6615(+)